MYYVQYSHVIKIVFLQNEMMEGHKMSSQCDSDSFVLYIWKWMEL